MNNEIASKVFVVDDDDIFSTLIEKYFQDKQEYDITRFSSASAFIDNLNKNPDIVVLDYHLPVKDGIEILKCVKEHDDTIQAIMLSGQSEPQVVVDAYNNGANGYIVKNGNTMPELENSLKNLTINVRLRRELEALKEKVAEGSKCDGIIGGSNVMKKVLNLAHKAENIDMLTLITGESGTGKELIAKCIHNNSLRKNKPFVAVNMAAIPEDLIESELFGHVKGAFTGAISKRTGKFEEANKGTIFLDEIGEMDINLQTKLLRVLQDSKICKVGCNKEIKLDVRIVAATNQQLNELVKQGKFREDLYYRLQGFLIQLPPP